MATHNAYDLSGRVALLPGGLGGIGTETSRLFAKAGAQVVITGTSERPNELAALYKRLGSKGEQPAFILTDVLQEGAVQNLIATVLQRYGRLDILINFVGGWAAGQPVTETDEATWRRMLDLNLNTAFLLAKHAAPPMARQGWGRIVHVSSRGARIGRRNAAAYAVAKNAVLTLTEVQAEELRDSGVTVNAILPSIVDTPANRAGMPNADHSTWPKADEIARVLLFLASNDAGLISGASIPVYGRA